MTINPSDERGAAESAEGETRAGLADVISLPDLSQPEPPKPARQGSRKGRHFGPRRVPDPRSARLDVRCTPEFRAKVLAAADAAGLSLSAFICAELGEAPSPRSHRSPPGPDMVLLAQAKVRHGSNGGFLNQIAKKLNSYEFRGQPELLEMREFFYRVLTEHREVSAVLMRALGGRSVTDDH